MIPLTHLDRTHFWLNASLIVTIEEAPDTVISITTGTSMMVKETAAQVLELIIDFHHRANASPPLPLR